MAKQAKRIGRATIIIPVLLLIGTLTVIRGNMKNSSEFVESVEASGAACGWECCRPLRVQMHAVPIAAVDPDPVNDPNVIDIAIERTDPNADTSVPIDFRILYCPELTGCNSGSETWVTGTVDVFGNITFDAVPLPVGSCGFDFDGMTPPSGYAPAPLTYSFGQSRMNFDTTPCMNNIGIHHTDFPPCFVDTDYEFYIARTLAPPPPETKSLCFTRIEFRVDAGVDDPTYFVQHDYDMTPLDPNVPSGPVVGPCPLNTYPDQYVLGANGWLTLTRDDLTRQYLLGPLKPCNPPDIDAGGNVTAPGGQTSNNHCVIAIFGTEWE